MGNITVLLIINQRTIEKIGDCFQNAVLEWMKKAITRYWLLAEMYEEDIIFRIMEKGQLESPL